ncbi:hypothetical protein SAY87_002376 [Trapa incisa]|uniref:DOG1 domain-containing protein n=1 Tax=Trapa incisa TaxID=236973 RepID=A0AAN7JWN6_9MYRT|nr:hypothetical protein SAY87_002376 [Trapa incisa]
MRREEGGDSEDSKGRIGVDQGSAFSGSSQCTSFESHDASATRDMQEKHFLRATCVLEDLIEEELDRYRSYYTRPVDPARHDDLSKPLQLASVGWLGDWRPTAMLTLLTGLAQSSGSFCDPAGIERTVSGLVREARIEEAVIDGELAEIQATCVLNPPFAFAGNHHGRPSPRRNGPELQKIKQVMAKAQQLRFKTLETVVRKVPNMSDAAEFLTVFERIQQALHRFATDHELRHGEVSFSTKGLGILDST